MRWWLGGGFAWTWWGGDMHRLANRCCSVLSDGTGYVIGALFIKGVTLVTTPVSLGIFFTFCFDFFCRWKSCLSSPELRRSCVSVLVVKVVAGADGFFIGVGDSANSASWDSPRHHQPRK
ncbi:uncharacterized protein LOC114168277 [Vigna unguiculata]|uniref:uncharacterized protein LOC114168277 n=1 Tax=Vigna unguiculata TaxID=3917 RepID=UPI001016F1A7|nr:uncharacterized protein LOC114168277 [Vigna unguiculata]